MQAGIQCASYPSKLFVHHNRLCTVSHISPLRLTTNCVNCVTNCVNCLPGTSLSAIDFGEGLLQTATRTIRFERNLSIEIADEYRFDTMGNMQIDSFDSDEI